jgi:hypothetical protein
MEAPDDVGSYFTYQDLDVTMDGDFSPAEYPHDNAWNWDDWDDL